MRKGEIICACSASWMAGFVTGVSFDELKNMALSFITFSNAQDIQGKTEAFSLHQQRNLMMVGVFQHCNDKFPYYGQNVTVDASLIASKYPELNICVELVNKGVRLASWPEEVS